MSDNDIQLIKRNVALLLKKFDYQRKELAQKFLQQLKDVVRKNDSVIPSFVDHIFENLGREDSDLRLCLVLIADYFFQRSHKFRLELIDHLQDFLIYTIETDPLHYPLPRPPEAANTLKMTAMKIVRLWIEKFSPGYPKLQNVHRFLNSSKSFDFNRANAELLVERQRAAEEQERKTRESMKIVEKVQKLYEENSNDIEKCLTEARTAIELVFPKFDDDADYSVSSARTSSVITNQLHGITPQSNGVSIVLPMNGVQISETEDNIDLFNALKDIAKLLEFYVRNINKWLQKLAGTENSTNLLKILIDTKNKLNTEIEKCKDLGVDKPNRQRKSEEYDAASSGDDDDDFEDVVKEGLELDFNHNNDSVPQHVLDRIAELENQADLPGPSGTQPQNSKAATKCTLSTKKPTIPTLSYGLDLKYWGQDVEPAEIPKNPYEEHRFWRPPDEHERITEAEEVYKSRAITFVGEMPAIKRRCRAPLPSGKLCPRMDREKCPVHGPIIDRDEMGYPLSERKDHTLQAESDRLVKQKEKEEIEFLKDVEKQTGRNLVISSGHTRIKKREKSEAVKSRERLSTKLFDRRTLKRVSDTLLAIQKQRAEKRFAHQFNYVVTNKK